MMTGTNIIVHNGLRIQTSRNMVVVRQNEELILINTVRLSEDGLKSLEKLGQVKNIIRIGAFHGRDDVFYQNLYNANFGAVSFLVMTKTYRHIEKLRQDLESS